MSRHKKCYQIKKYHAIISRK